MDNSHVKIRDSIPSALDSSEGPEPTASETASCSGSLSCSDLIISPSYSQHSKEILLHLGTDYCYN